MPLLLRSIAVALAIAAGLLAVPGCRLRGTAAPQAQLAADETSAAASGGAAAQARPEERRPNVLLIVVDALRADRLECYGYSRQTSPILNALAQEGVLFTDDMSQGAETVVAVPTLLTGRRPREHGVLWARRGDKVWMGPGLRLPTLATILKEKGYTTAAVSGNPLVGPSIGVERGFDSFDQRAGKVYTWLHASGVDINACAYDWLRTYRPEKGPFFLYLHYIDPHNQYRPPSPFCVFGRPGYTPQDDVLNKDMNDVSDPHFDKRVTREMLLKHGVSEADVDRLSDLYDGEVLSADHYIGAFLERLKKEGLYDNTIIVVTADHGESFMDHRNLEHGGSLYQELIRVPLIIKAPGIRGGQEVGDLVETVDVAPTILAAAGITPDVTISGRSFYEQLKSGKPINDEVGMAELPAKKMYAVRVGKLKLIEGPDQVELYDLAQDPHELRDLASARPDEVKRLKGVLRELLRTHPPAAEGTEPASQREIEALKALGYLK
jgi:arylsulfatase A-like enzyme